MQTFCNVDDEVLHVGHNARCAETSPVLELVYCKLLDIDAIDEIRADLFIDDPEGGGHVACCNGVQLGSEAYHSSSLANDSPHGVLRLVYIRVDLRHRPVITYRPSKDQTLLLLHHCIDYPILDVLLSMKVSMEPYSRTIFRTSNIVVSIGILSWVYMFFQAVEISCLKVMGSKGVTCEDAINIAILYEQLHRSPRVIVKGNSRTKHKDNVANVPFSYSNSSYSLS